MFSFQDFLFFVFGTSEEDSLCNKMSQDGIIVCYRYSSSILYMTSYIMFLQMFRHNICNRRKQKQNRLVTRQFFPSVVKNGPGIRLITNSSYCNLSTTCHLYYLCCCLWAEGMNAVVRIPHKQLSRIQDHDHNTKEIQKL